MEHRPLISVIVPVYKVEAYLDKCISSIVNQTYTNLEIILVDDGSPDRSGEICEEWGKRDSRIQVVHKANGGLSDARNVGMGLAKGELMGFVDSDDWISCDMYQLLYENMMKYDSDIAACGVEMVWEDGTQTQMLTRPGECLMDAKSAMQAIIEESWLKQPVWYKLYKTGMIRDISFPIGKCHEDVFWSYRAVGRAKRVSVFDAPCYFYKQRSDSIMGQQYSLKRLDALEAMEERIRYISYAYPQLLSSAKRAIWFFGMYSMQKLFAHPVHEERTKGERTIRQVLKGIPITLRDLDGTSKKNVFWLIMAKCSLRLTCKVRCKLKIGL